MRCSEKIKQMFIANMRLFNDLDTAIFTTAEALMGDLNIDIITALSIVDKVVNNNTHDFKKTLK